MIGDFARAFAQLGDRALLRVLVGSLALTLLVFAALGVAGYFGARWLIGDWGAASPGIAALLAIGAAVIAGWLLFRAVAIAILGLFGDAVVLAVERRHYPAAAARARPVGIGRSAALAAGSVGRVVGYNLLAAPLYVILAATGVGLPLAFLVMNGWLLGRDLGDMVAVRQLDPSQLADWRARTRVPRFVAGLASAALLMVPLVNLLAPIVGAAAMTHLFHRERKAA